MTSSIHPTVRLNKYQKIRGKWNKRTYTIVRLIGEGARGSIYLALLSQQYVALKISQDSSVVSAEVNALKMLKKVQGQSLGPLLLDVDDVVLGHQTVYAFYVMEYIDGVPLNTWVKQEGLQWLFPASQQLLSQLHQLHNLGHIFGDLKPENILVDRKSKQVRLVDVGGVTPFGRSIREYTTWYDRGYWKLGDRRAEPSYDLFAYAVCLLSMDPHIKIQQMKSKDIEKVIQSATSLKPLHAVIRHALHGEFDTAVEMKHAIEQVNQKQLKVSQTKTSKSNFKMELMGVGTIVTIHFALLYYFIW
ncbi:protein kinase domain-containing protein [Aquisalibacillus elongatus]|uniref:Serine/threonine-protein kinase n=1 Tax=Aquisalibacillus elongatus TaxID=485577 RepID=A0A3N5B1U3_9BACI|nr:protein kinase [Aquisalibacillus elongatus]RPF51217.1 serine/threonine-protein kinase [Aquisalibacillus elongatus]